MVPAWGGLLPALQSGQVPWAAAHPAETTAGRDFWGYLEVGVLVAIMKYETLKLPVKERCRRTKHGRQPAATSGAAYRRFHGSCHRWDWGMALKLQVCASRRPTAGRDF